MIQVNTLDVINTMLGVLQTENSEETKKLAKEIVDKKVREIYDRMIETSAKQAGLIT